MSLSLSHTHIPKSTFFLGTRISFALQTFSRWCQCKLVSASEVPSLRDVTKVFVCPSVCSLSTQGCQMMRMCLMGCREKMGNLVLIHQWPPCHLSRDTQVISSAAAKHSEANKQLAVGSQSSVEYVRQSTEFITVCTQVGSEDNYFKLNLTAMHEGGLYFCEINNSSPAFQCLQSDSPLRKRASINIVVPELETVQGEIFVE